METKLAVIGYLIRNEGKEVCLAMHKKQGKWNGFGGKVGDKIDETVEEALKREAKEEFGINILTFTKRGEVVFEWPHKQEQIVGNVYTCTNWEGEIKTNHEMNKPTWFKIVEIPWDEMWDSDILWLKDLLSSNKTLKAKYVFDKEGNHLTDQEEVTWQ